jgi:hypothetical protein
MKKLDDFNEGRDVVFKMPMKREEAADSKALEARSGDYVGRARRLSLGSSSSCSSTSGYKL